MREEAFSTQREKSGRRARRDKGSHQVTGRDRELLAYVGEQYALTLDQLAVLIGRSYRTARGLRDRWADAGWARSAKLSVELPPFVWLTSRGSTIAGGRFRTWQPNHGLVSHLEAVTNVRLLLERRLRLGGWECERSLARHVRSGRRPNAHLPDAVLHTESRVAIEVELTRKSRSRLKKIVTDLSVDYDRVLYFAADRPYPTLAELAAESPLGNIAVHPYPLDTADVTALRLTSR